MNTDARARTALLVAIALMLFTMLAMARHADGPGHDTSAASAVLGS